MYHIEDKAHAKTHRAHDAVATAITINEMRT